jgi:NTP pyrophosphatase (non-canonical NTP hydrolase)
MHLSDYQSSALRTLNRALSREEQIVDAAAGLAEEAGEVLGVVRKHRYQGRPLDREAVVEELGDVLWCLAALAAGLGVTLEEAAESNLAKLRRRHPEGLSAPPARPEGPTGDDLH